MTDHELIVALKKGDNDAFTIIIKGIGGRFVTFHGFILLRMLILKILSNRYS